MPRHTVVADRRRHLLPLPPGRHEQLPFVIDAVSGRIIAPWPPKRGSLADERRLDATLAKLESGPLPASVCWCWPHRPPEPVHGVNERGGSDDRAEAEPRADAGSGCGEATAEETGQNADAEARGGRSGGDGQVSQAGLRQLLPAL